MQQKCYYETLNISKTASGVEIKRAYRKLAMKYHPDRNPDDKEAEIKFKEVSEAYEILSDDQKRSRYDQFGHASVNQQGGAGGAGGFGGFEDIFDNFFGGGSSRGGAGRSRAARGSDLEYTLEISLEEAFFGVEKEITIPKMAACDACEGTGSKSKSKTTCHACNGQGTIRRQQGFFAFEQTCPACNGSGSNISDPCDACYGNGKVKKQKVLKVKIPEGVDNGDRIRLHGEGDSGSNGAMSGDLYVQILIKDHRIFERREMNLYCEMPISFTKACLGGEINVPTLDGEVTLKVIAETQTGKVFRLREKGMKSLRGHRRGDLLCKVVVETPINLNAEQKELLGKFADSLGEDYQSKHSPKSKSWFDNVKDYAKSFFE
ncbi:chaperone protein DnaJ [Francisella halioticida]|uniref:Chaperone protein DnaJ n=1 Tax=Francisella halioticida TaxID=549298 RepID=A0ABN5AZA3_9GAMM|nr:molecular chaperone DnaJ [Francisella halioticida]ASG67522.1 molecular chaperone DnaJ [Francisella halioticida]BCD90012.1 chaperone protein DnaJ [Francisella halioticida]